MAKVNFSTNIVADGGVNLSKRIEADVQVASEHMVGMDHQELPEPDEDVKAGYVRNDAQEPYVKPKE